MYIFNSLSIVEIPHSYCQLLCYNASVSRFKMSANFELRKERLKSLLYESWALFSINVPKANNNHIPKLWQLCLQVPIDKDRKDFETMSTCRRKVILK